MEMYEIRAIMDYQYYAYKDGWEQSRLVAYLIAQSNSTKKIKLTDIMRFYWDDEKEEASDTSISTEDINRLRQKAQQYINTI